MIDLKPDDQARLRRALRYLDDEAPLAPDLPEHGLVASPGRKRRPVVVLVGAFVLTILAIAPITLLNSENVTPSEPSPPATSAATAPPPAPDTGDTDEFAVVQEVDGTGTLIGLKHGVVWRSDDDGETWHQILVDGRRYDLLDVANDGSVLAVRNSNETVEGTDPETRINETPAVLRYHPTVADWEAIELPRPELPVPGLEPAPDDGGCAKYGLTWDLRALAMSVGEEILILGEHRFTGEGVCDEVAQFLWTSPDGQNWSVLEAVGIDGHMVGMTEHEGRHIAYGSASPWKIATDFDRVPLIWTSTDGGSWEPADVDLSALPDDHFVSFLPDNEAGTGSWVVSPATTSGGSLTLRMWAESPIYGIDTNMTEEDLAEWAIANDRFVEMTTSESLEAIDIGFPLDEKEVLRVRNWLDAHQPAGHLILESADGLTWTSSFERR